jgi:hypothetical protein
MADIKGRHRDIEKKFNQKQNFVSSMKVLIDKAKETTMNPLEKFKDSLNKDMNSKTMSLTEAIDQFAQDFDLGTLKQQQMARNQPGVVEHKTEEVELRGIASRGGDTGVDVGEGGLDRPMQWYEQSKIKTLEEGAGGGGGRNRSTTMMMTKNRKQHAGKHGGQLS